MMDRMMKFIHEKSNWNMGRSIIQTADNKIAEFEHFRFSNHQTYISSKKSVIPNTKAAKVKKGFYIWRDCRFNHAIRKPIGKFIERKNAASY